MKKEKKAFSLIEVMVAWIILSISVFGVFKLIAENTKIINNSDNYRTANSLFNPLIECIENIEYSGFTNKTIWENYRLNFWSDLKWCEIWDTNQITLDNIDYILESEIIWHEANEFIEFSLTINTDSINIKKEYKLLN